MDFHAQCESYVRISIKDLNGKFGVYLDADHPNQHRYPGVKVAACQLAAEHPGECEMFVEGECREQYQGYWLAWHHRSKYDELQNTTPNAARPRAPPDGNASATPTTLADTPSPLRTNSAPYGPSGPPTHPGRRAGQHRAPFR